ncbi:hypothetical protein [Epilithonimonas sp.]|uniref:hypothetical protein n=1 Tax=Epilithonimonas sp. TaxID=2894511 RepID=UPI0028A069E2|nr:hypothetical protein [Epilithonimonas sp.]
MYIDRHPRVGNFIRIDIPGPDNVRSKGFDWVRIDEITSSTNNEKERHLITCRPSAFPKGDPKTIEHFYSDSATSTFIIEKGIDYIKVGIYGRNEMLNKKNVGILNTIRNFLVTFGGFLKLTKIQWKALADGMLIKFGEKESFLSEKNQLQISVFYFLKNKALPYSKFILAIFNTEIPCGHSTSHASVLEQ